MSAVEVRPASVAVELAELTARCDRLLAAAARRCADHPWLVVACMHELARHLYPRDPYLPWPEDEPPTARAAAVMEGLTSVLEAAGALGSYLQDRPEVLGRPASGGRASSRRADEGPTQRVYGPFWDRLDPETCLDEARALLEGRVPGLAALVAGRTVLDLGCGSGRHTIAMARAGAALAVGVDLGETSLAAAGAMAERAGVANVCFEAASVLALPFETGTFDFVLCNGVLHHCGDLDGGLRELARVLAGSGSAFVYLYGAGGLFWHARRRMREVMQRIPQAYATAVLDLLGMPPQRFIFADNWYVPIEEHLTREDLERRLHAAGLTGLRKVVGTRSTDLDRAVAGGDAEARCMWGDGEHRYLVRKGP